VASASSAGASASGASSSAGDAHAASPIPAPITVASFIKSRRLKSLPFISASYQDQTLIQIYYVEQVIMLVNKQDLPVSDFPPFLGNKLTTINDLPIYSFHDPTRFSLA
jgi:hypothetical protein